MFPNALETGEMGPTLLLLQVKCGPYKDILEIRAMELAIDDEMFVCVCVWERERERERKGGRRSQVWKEQEDASQESLDALWEK